VKIPKQKDSWLSNTFLSDLGGCHAYVLHCTLSGFAHFQAEEEKKSRTSDNVQEKKMILCAAQFQRKFLTSSS